MDLDSIESDGTPDHNNCMEWCNFNSSCGGFSLYLDTCYFKNDDCENDMTRASSTDLHIKQGRWFIWNIFQSKKRVCTTFGQYLKMFWNNIWDFVSIKCSFLQLHTLSIRIRTVCGATTSIQWGSQQPWTMTTVKIGALVMPAVEALLSTSMLLTLRIRTARMFCLTKVTEWHS